MSNFYDIDDIPKWSNDVLGGALHFMKHAENDIVRLCFILNNPLGAIRFASSTLILPETLQGELFFEKFKVKIISHELPRFRQVRTSLTQGYINNSNITVFIFKDDFILRYDHRNDIHHERMPDLQKLYSTLKDWLN